MPKHDPKQPPIHVEWVGSPRLSDAAIRAWAVLLLDSIEREPEPPPDESDATPAG